MWQQRVEGEQKREGGVVMVKRQVKSNRRRGQSTLEYLLVLGVILAAVVAILTGMRTKVDAVLNTSVDVINAANNQLNSVN